ncbi:MAG: bifunctional metallophosphatase/5'-nucleotidase [FCB group bacterium]|nr:bifunctional metallophosphatase/5'-nucleotidase [FCB group bacterium]
MKYLHIIILSLALVLSSCSGERTAEITILHWNDFHSQNIPWVPARNNPEGHTVGGYAVLDAYLDSLQGVYPGALRVHTGDEFQGSPVCAVTKGVSQIEILNVVQPDFFTVGNHELDYSWHHLDSLRRHVADFQMYAANLIDTRNGESPLPQYRVFSRDRYRFALIGLTHPELDFLTMPKNLQGIQVADHITATRDIIHYLKRRGVCCFVVVSHMGIETDRELARAVPDIDLIVGGHSHTYMQEAEQVNGVWIVQAGDRGRYVGVTRFTAGREGIASLDMQYVETLTANIRPSPDVAEIVDKYEAKLAEEMNRVIGELKTPWIRSSGESNIGNWIADAFRQAAGTDIAIMNNGGIRKDMAVGKITVRDMWEIAPFGNTLVTFAWTGEQLLRALNHMTIENMSMQFSGIRMVLDRKKGVVDVKVNGKPLDPAKIYTIAANDYTVSQTHRYFGLDIPPQTETGLVDRDILIRNVEKQPNITSRIEGRIIYQ